MDSRWCHSHPNLPQYNWEGDAHTHGGGYPFNDPHQERKMRKKKKLLQPQSIMKNDRDLVGRQAEMIYSSTGKSCSKKRLKKSKTRHGRRGSDDEGPGGDNEAGCDCRCRECGCAGQVDHFSYGNSMEKHNHNRPSKMSMGGHMPMSMPMPMGMGHGGRSDRYDYEDPHGLSMRMNDMSLDPKSRHDLLNWVNGKLNTNFNKIEALSSGVAYCQLMNILFPGSVPLKKVKFHTMYEVDSAQNLKLLQNALQKMHVDKVVPIEKLIKGRFQDNFEFLQWFKNFFIANYKEMPCRANDISNRGLGAGHGVGGCPGMSRSPIHPSPMMGYDNMRPKMPQIPGSMSGPRGPYCMMNHQLNHNPGSHNSGIPPNGSHRMPGHGGGPGPDWFY